ncbi:hypothetical protein [Breoghania sp. JC706]|uniref:hypothetical protein n=1 Tax=Breoghania sp. JC706 TaxID=3117732 RepID=UPI00300B091D
MTKGTNSHTSDVAGLDYVRGTLLFCAEELSKLERPYADLLLPVLDALTKDIEKQKNVPLAEIT